MHLKCLIKLGYITIIFLFFCEHSIAINKCVINGNTIYQQAPCSDDTKQELNIQYKSNSSSSNAKPGLRQSEIEALQRLRNNEQQQQTQQQNTGSVAPSLDSSDALIVRDLCDKFLYYSNRSKHNPNSQASKNARDKLRDINEIFIEYGFTRPIRWTCPPEGSDLNCYRKVRCDQMTSCSEASFYYNDCGLSYLDNDDDGLACNVLCQ